MSEQQVRLMLLTVWMVHWLSTSIWNLQWETFLILHLVFNNSYFHDFHSLIFDFHDVLAEFYRHIREFLSFCDAFRRRTSSLPNCSVCVAKQVIIAALLRAKRSTQIVIILIFIDDRFIYKSNTDSICYRTYNLNVVLIYDLIIIIKPDLDDSFYNVTDPICDPIFYPTSGGVNPSFENGLSPWRLQGSSGIDTDASGVKEGESRTGTHSFHAVGVEPGWFIDISQNFDVTPNTAYEIELWSKSVMPGCYVTMWFLNQYASYDTATTYTKLSLSIPREDVTPEAVASESMMLIEFLCDGVGGYGPDYAMFIDDITVTVVQ
ncbi:hypothetical protein CcaCcLH18_01246 [Colletotrichum camelliae]|nr:hypothetical protein CcaCcLH18_01246 [Colletotrichum camelliae]